MNIVITPAAVTVSGAAASATASTGTPVVKDYIEAPPYEGSYSITPSGEEQVLETAGKRCGENIVIQPVPSNYGLITWTGSVLTVT